MACALRASKCSVYTHTLTAGAPGLRCMCACLNACADLSWASPLSVTQSLTMSSSQLDSRVWQWLCVIWCDMITDTLAIGHVSTPGVQSLGRAAASSAGTAPGARECPISTVPQALHASRAAGHAAGRAAGSAPQHATTISELTASLVQGHQATRPHPGHGQLGHEPRGNVVRSVAKQPRAPQVAESAELDRQGRRRGQRGGVC